ncbi:MAG: DUF3467 domain-containing protein [Elusimicrobia bacterium]|nr:DUF3467 domain-containing protein [Elusimicrobiota bacterium]
MNKQESEGNKQQLQVSLDEETAMGKFANLGFISHSPEEFVIDFVFRPPGSPKARVLSRVLMTPGHAKRLMGALKENLEKYEKKFGKIKSYEQPTNPIGF